MMQYMKATLLARRTDSHANIFFAIEKVECQNIQKESFSRTFEHKRYIKYRQVKTLCLY